MHDIRRLREQPDAVRKALALKGFEADVEGVLNLDERWRQLTARGDELKSELNRVSKAIGEAKKAGGDAAEEMEAARKVREEASQIDEEKRSLRLSIDDLLMTWPSEPDPSAPQGKSTEENVLVREVGEESGYDFKLKNHLEIAEQLKLLDMARGAKLTGTGWPVYIGKGASLERALLNFMLDVQTNEHGYEEVFVPFVVNRASATGTSQLPKFEEDLYRIESEDFFLIPTAEVPLTNLHADEILSAEELPKRYAAYSACFRREAGAHGAETRGLQRVHQFNKVELVEVCQPEKSEEAHQRILDNAEEILKRLGMRYRVIELCTGDLSFGAAKCYDIELWSPATKSWLEVSSVSNFRDFQARRMNLRFRPEGGGKPEFAHTLNGSGLATPRLLVAMLETFQTAEGDFLVPEVLRPYLSGLDRISGAKP